jgi:hypothetical protein
MQKPLDNIPSHLIKDFTMNGTIPIYKWYIDESVPNNKPIIWSEIYIQSYIKRFTLENIMLNQHGKEQYKGASMFIVDACYKYINFIKGKDVAVIGSQHPWVEAILYNSGAKSITTVEYNVPICKHDVIKTISYKDFCLSDIKYDSIFSYSSLEHSGLGRYGDELNPNGDIETIHEIYRSLKAEGLFFLGVPIGEDYLVWNAHRIYGKKRLSLLIKDKFNIIDWIGCKSDYIENTKNTSGNPEYNIQPLIVLKTIT